jgi:hypothetical protein
MFHRSYPWKNGSSEAWGKEGIAGLAEKISKSGKSGTAAGRKSIHARTAANGGRANIFSRLLLSSHSLFLFCAMRRHSGRLARAHVWRAITFIRMQRCTVRLRKWRRREGGRRSGLRGVQGRGNRPEIARSSEADPSRCFDAAAGGWIGVRDLYAPPLGGPSPNKNLLCSLSYRSLSLSLKYNTQNTLGEHQIARICYAHTLALSDPILQLDCLFDIDLQ